MKSFSQLSLLATSLVLSGCAMQVAFAPSTDSHSRLANVDAPRRSWPAMSDKSDTRPTLRVRDGSSVASLPQSRHFRVQDENAGDVPRFEIVEDRNGGQKAVVGEGESQLQPTAITEQSAVVSEQPAVITDQPATITNEPATVVEQPTIITTQHSEVSEPPIVISDQKTAVTEQQPIESIETIVRVSGEEPMPILASPVTTDDIELVDAVPLFEEAPSPIVEASESTEAIAVSQNRFPVDLTTVLRLAGANNLQIALATERVHEARARQQGANALWIPNLTGGIGYNKHEGRIQSTPGPVIETSRNSLFVGGGAAVGVFPITGGSGGPFRLAADLSLVDVYFEPLAARQEVTAARADESANFNDTLLQATLTYLELVRAQQRVVVANEAAKNANELVRLTEEFERAGAGLEADAARARAERAQQRRDTLVAEERAAVMAAELVRLLHLDSSVDLYSADSDPIAISMISEGIPLPDLIQQALYSRPELVQDAAIVAATKERMRQEQWRPWIPNLHLGASAGGFGGGIGSKLRRWDDRADFDALAVWKLNNFGLGNRAQRRERESQHRQAYLGYAQTRDIVVADVTQAYHRVRLRMKQIEQARLEVKAASGALPLNFQGIEGRELRPIEAQQAIVALAEGRNRLLDSIIGYNQAQFQLMRALGQPPEYYVSGAEWPQELMPAPDAQ